ncbi:olfactory receptor 1361-like [Bombina bombina]|uniref:olfactory receptor 1361-like n=1 Tax=Bombina bombina TaxID=8345 RepID=UPI00235AD5E2|nr:olfactory receptor 1361-like [Bombina bombina]
MESSNQTSVTRFVLLGLSNIPFFQPIYFLLFLVIYIVTLSGNILLIIVVRIDNRLHTPMYFFLSNLSFIDICFSSTTVPKILVNTLSQDKSISFFGCAAQMYFSLALGATECIILAVMAYDRYIAICKPLHYTTIMNKVVCICLAATSWIVSFLNALLHAFLTFRLPYCKSNHVNHFSSHLTVVSLYYGTIIFMYLRPRHSYSPRRDRAVSILYTVVTPMLNPIIYSIRNKDVKGTLRKTLNYE